MTLTRSQKGLVPKKTEHPGYVETPTRRRTRHSGSPFIEEEEQYIKEETEGNHSAIEVKSQKKRKSQTNGHVNGSIKHANGSANLANGKAVDSKDIKTELHYEFGGPLGVSAIMIGFPIIMYYMWIGATYYDGRIPSRSPGQSYSDFLKHLVHLAYTGAFPSPKAWAIYWTFGLFEMAMYCLLPGVTVKGQKLLHEGGRQLDYHCSGLWAWWATIGLAMGLHVSGIFPLYIILDEFGPIMSVAILSSVGLSLITYISAFARGKQYRMTGSHVYDFFMGAELNPRLFGILDLKMFYEVRIPWYMLFLISCAAGARQYEQFGYISGEVAFIIMAHWLYANACAKGEELIVTTWDMYYEKLGFMLTFWNLAGVPLSYCHCAIYLANHAPEEYRWNRAFLAGLFTSYLFVYWIWDTANSQKNRFRHSASGGYAPRKAFPQLPWQELKNPQVIETKAGKQLLVDGWYGIARKVHYTCDIYFAITWGLITGFKSPFPWFYCFFFCPMIIHRAIRDTARCRKVYAEAWEEYERRVPYIFIPYVF